MRTPAQTIVRAIGGIVCGLCFVASAHAQTTDDTEREALELDQNCIINILNRTVSVQDDGTWFLANVPSNMGQIRARATCTRDGVTERGASDYFNIVNNEFRETPQIYKAVKERVPTKVVYASPGSSVYTFNEDGTLTYKQFNNQIFLTEIGESYQALVNAHYADGSVEDVTQSSSGINYISTNTAIASVTNNGLITAVSPGNASIVARKDEVISILQITVNAGEDLDGDGLPDDYETANGLNPNDPIDAQEDIDGDGLTALEEYNAGTSIHRADTDGDGINDREEITLGADGVITNALLVDSDGDLLPDLVEVTIGTDPNDASDFDFEAAIVAIRSVPSSVSMTFNSIDSEVSTQLTIMATLVDGSSLDVTSSSFGTEYTSSDLTIVSFGTTDGEVFGGDVGEAEVTVTLYDLEITIAVTVETFQPVGRSALTISGNATDSDVQGDWVYIAAGSAGVHVVDVSDKDNPSLESTYSDALGALDVKVSGDQLFIARGSMGLDIVDVSDKANPTLIVNYQTSGPATELAFDNGLLFVANGAGGLEIIDVSEPDTPLSVSVLGNLGTAIGVDAQNDRAVVINSSALMIIDISDPSSPMRLGSINIGNLRAVVMNGDYAYVACYTCGYKVINISDPMSPQIVGGDARFYPTDIELTNGLAFFAETLFVNAVPYVNIFDPENSLFQGVIDIRQFGDRDAYGLSLDAGFVYSVGYNRLYISQYRMLNDTQGVPPAVTIVQPQDGAVVVEGSKIQVQISATDDIAVSVVQLTVNDELITSDTTLPYEIPYIVPNDVTALDIKASAIDFGNNVGEDNVLVSVEPDADGDGLGDTEEANTWMTEPDNPDTDGDTLTDGDEVRRGTNPLSKDTDDDGIEDGDEVQNGTDPTNPDTTPPTVSSIDPVADATEICENQSITVTFSEAMQRKSIVSANIVVRDDDTKIAVGTGITLQTMDTEAYINPTDLLADNTTYQIVISNVRDSAGNLLASTFESLFTTGNCVDEERPYVVDSSPVNGASDIGVNAKITILLNEPVEPDTVTEESFYVYDQSSGQRINGFIELTENNSALVFTPNTPLLVGRRHYVIVTSAILDQFGNPMVYNSRYFNTSFEPDGDAPQIVATTVVDDQTGVPQNVKPAVQFDEQVNALYLSDIKLLDDIGDIVPVTRSLSPDRRRVLLSPVQPLEASSQYSFLVDGVQDLSGNLLTTSQQIDFTTSDVSDTETGSAVNWSIPNNTRDVPLNAKIQVHFSEPLDPTSVNSSTFYLQDTSANLRVKGSVELSNNNQTLTFVADDLLREQHQHYLYVGYSPYLTDLAGNLVAQNNYHYFYTGSDTDEAAPEVLNMSMTEGMTGVPVNAQFVITLDSPLSSSCDFAGNVTLTTGDTEVEITASLSSDRTTLTLSTSGLEASTTYTLTFGGWCDYAGNTLTAKQLTFTTSDSDTSDTTAPQLVSITPTHTSTDVSVTTSVEMVFDEVVSALTAPKLTGAGVTVPGDYEVDGTTVTFTPEITLAGNTRYTTELYYTVADLAGNTRYLGTRYFTTQEVQDDSKPEVLAISPVNGATDVSPYQSVVLTFSEPVNINTLNGDNIALFSFGERISANIYRSADGRQVTLSAALPASSLISLVMTANVTDLSGNRILPFISSFTTGISNSETSRPQIVKQVPANGSSGWTNLSDVYFYTNEPLDTATLEDAFKLAENGILIDVTIESMGDGRTIKVSRDDVFADNALVQLYWTGDATDYAGNPMNNYQTYFNTGDAGERIGERPWATAYSPNNGNNDVPLNPLLRIQFNEPLNDATISNDTVILYDVTNGWSQLPIDVGLDDTGTIVMASPQALLEPDTTYYIQTLVDILDTDGDNLASNYATYFHTGPDAVEDDRAPMLLQFSPPDGIEDVGTLPQFALRADEALNSLSFSHPNTYNVLFSENNRVVRYEYLTPLTAGQQQTESTPAIADWANNALAQSEFSFTTTNGPDLTSPLVTDISVTNGETDVAVNRSFEVTFNEPIDEVSLVADGTYLSDSVTNQVVPASIELSADGKHLTYTPSEALLSGRDYYLYLYYAKDLGGNNLSYLYRRFTTGFEEDTVAPAITAATVEEGDTDVPINVRLNVRFSEAMAPINVDGIQLLDDNSNDVPFNWSLNRQRALLTIVPTQLLETQSSYRLVVSDQQDTSHNALDQALDVSFTTGDSVDLITGSIASWTPHQNNLTMATNPLLTVTFTEPVDKATIDSSTHYLYDASTSLNVPTTWALSEDGMTLTLVPDDPLRANHVFYWYLGYSPYLTDYAGNLVAQNSYRYFRTTDEQDETAPTIESFSLLDNSVDIPVNGRIVVRFDEPLAEGCSISGAFSASDGSSDINLNVSLQSDRRTVYVTAVDNWSADTTYTLTISGTCDYSGNVQTEQQISFTTGSGTDPDTTAPTLVSITPANNETDVDVGLTAVVMTFSERVEPTSLPYVTADSLTVPGTYTVDGNEITFEPATALQGSTLYTVNLQYTIFDLAGNNRYLGVTRFTTAASDDNTAPSVLAVSPNSDTTDVDPASTVRVTFDEPINQSTLTSNNIALYTDGQVIKPSISRSSDGTEVTLSAALPSSSLVSVVITDDITDLSGNALSPFISSFTTGAPADETGRPRVSAQIPQNGSSGWTELDSMVIIFTEAMAEASFENGLNVTEDGVLVDTEYNLSGDGRTLTITKAGGFTEQTRVQLYLTGNATDLAGNALYNHTGYFVMGSTGDAAGTRPRVLAYYPVSNTPGVPVNAKLTASFDEPMDSASINSDNVILYDVTDGWSVLGSSATLSADGKLIIVTPDALLAAENQYYIWYGSTLLDTDGDALASNYATYFTTAVDDVEDDAAPTVLEFSPPDGQEDVGTNTRLSVRFDEYMNPLTFDNDNGLRMNIQWGDNNRLVSYVRRLPFEPEQTVVETVSGITDTAGNVVQSADTSFTTGSGPDLDSPQLLDVGISNNQQSVPTNTVIRWIFNEPIDPVSITSGGVYLYDNTARATVASSYELSSDGKQLTVIPDEAFAESSQIYAYAYYLRDLSGNQGSSHYRYFTTSDIPDSIAPTVLNATVSDGATDVPINARLNVRFSESLNPLATAGIELKDSLDNPIPVNYLLSRSRTLITVVPKALLEPLTDYTLTISNVGDLSDNKLVTDFVASFTTGDTADFTASGVKHWSIPVNNTSNVALNPLLRVTLNERLDRATVDTSTFYLQDTTNNVRVPSTWTLSGDGMTLTLLPDDLLNPSARHYFYVGYSPYLTDYAGNLIAQNNYKYFNTGTEEDNDAISIANVSIPNGTTDMPVNGQIVMVMSEPVSDACLVSDNIEIRSGGTDIGTSVTLASDRQTITVKGNSNFTSSSTYTLHVNTLCDYSGNTLSNLDVLSFTTLSSDSNDTAGPNLTSIAPASGETNVDVTTTVTMVFDEPVAMTSRPLLKQGSTVIAGSYAVNGDTIIFTPSADLSSGVTYTVELYYNTADYAGNTRYLATRNFTTQ